MKFSNPRQVVALTLAWAILCYGLEKALVPSAGGLVGLSTSQGSQLRLWVQHMCCSGCSSAVEEAVAATLGPQARVSVASLPSNEQAEREPAAKASFGNWVVVEVPDVTKVDFWALDRAVRARGLVVGRMVLRLPVPSHVRFDAALTHLCCQQCVVGLQEELERARVQGAVTGRLKWLDSVTVDKPSKVVTAHATYLEAYEELDVRDLFGALDQAGFEPESVKLLADEEAPAAGGGMGR